MLFAPKKPAQYDDDFFADTRMSFGDHIEELRTHMVRAIAGLMVVLLGGLTVDLTCQALGRKDLGFARPMVDVITAPIETMARDFYAKRNQKVWEAVERGMVAPRPDPAETARVRAKRAANGGSLDALTAEERDVLARAPTEISVILPVGPLAKLFGPPKDPAATAVETTILVYPGQINAVNTDAELLYATKKYVTTLSVQEPFVVYFKVLLLCSFVIASPWVFYQGWSFVAAGLYPHERAYVYRFLGPSITLFLAGVLICQFYVLPGTVKALLGFNDWLDLDPDIRLNEWLNFALLLPLVFGVSFQTPLVMFFFNRIGTFTAADYWAKWRVAVMVLAVFAAVITPSPDVYTMLYLFVPMFGLYLVGVAVCYLFPPDHESAWKGEDQQVAV